MSIAAARTSIRRALTQLESTPLDDKSLRLRRLDLACDLRELESKLTDLLNHARVASQQHALREWERKHTAACRKHQEDPGATCICRDWSDKTQGTR